jgi:hypothetical protein
LLSISQSERSDNSAGGGKDRSHDFPPDVFTVFWSQPRSGRSVGNTKPPLGGVADIAQMRGEPLVYKSYPSIRNAGFFFSQQATPKWASKLNADRITEPYP